MKFNHFFILLGILISAHLNAQDIYDALEYTENNVSGTARFNAMSGAFSALGGDISSIFSNPAGSAVLNNNNFSFSLSTNNYSNENTILGTGEKKSKNNFGFDSVVIGTKKDRICFEIAEKVPEVVNLASKTSIRESMALISGATRVVGSDTGLAHAAEALGIKVTMILGPTSKETGATTILEDSVCIESKDTWCRPCSQNGSSPCYRSSQFCMDSIKTEEVHNTFVD